MCGENFAFFFYFTKFLTWFMFVCVSLTKVSCSQAWIVFLYVVFYCLELLLLLLLLLLLVRSASSAMILFLAYLTIPCVGKIMYVRMISG
jgi:hypothetical protein